MYLGLSNKDVLEILLTVIITWILLIIFKNILEMLLDKYEQSKIIKILAKKRVGDNIEGVIDELKFGKYIRIDKPMMNCMIVKAKVKIEGTDKVVSVLDAEHIGPSFEDYENVSFCWLKVGGKVKVYPCEDDTYRIDVSDVKESRAIMCGVVRRYKLGGGS